MTRQFAHKKKRRLAGLCGFEGCDAETGKRYYCDYHAQIRNEQRRALRQRRKAHPVPVAA